MKLFGIDDIPSGSFLGNKVSSLAAETCGFELTILSVVGPWPLLPSAVVQP